RDVTGVQTCALPISPVVQEPPGLQIGWTCSERDGERDRPRAATDREIHRLARSESGEDEIQRMLRVDLAPTDAQDDVSLAHSGLLRGATPHPAIARFPGAASAAATSRP